MYVCFYLLGCVCMKYQNCFLESIFHISSTAWYFDKLKTRVHMLTPSTRIPCDILDFGVVFMDLKNVKYNGEMFYLTISTAISRYKNEKFKYPYICNHTDVLVALNGQKKKINTILPGMVQGSKSVGTERRTEIKEKKIGQTDGSIDTCEKKIITRKSLFCLSPSLMKPKGVIGVIVVSNRPGKYYSQIIISYGPLFHLLSSFCFLGCPLI